MPDPAHYDPRLHRALSDGAGLARRVNEIERRQNAAGAVQADTPLLPVPAGAIYGSGAFFTVLPPNGTTGPTFTIPATGKYLCLVHCSSYVTVVGMGYVDIHLDGNTTPAGNSELFFNNTNVHMPMMVRPFFYSFTTTGTHYFYPRNVASTSDNNDRYSFTYFRIGAF